MLTDDLVVPPTPDPLPIEDAGRPVAKSRTVEVVVSLMLLAFAALLGWENWRTGAAWEAEGPQAGYFPFYLAVLLALATLYGLLMILLGRGGDEGVFVTREQLARVLQVLVPTLLFVVATQWLGLYVASFLLVAGFMGFIGRIAWWKSLVTAFLFTAAMFATFEIAFNVIMPKGPLEAAFGY